VVHWSIFIYHCIRLIIDSHSGKVISETKTLTAVMFPAAQFEFKGKIKTDYHQVTVHVLTTYVRYSLLLSETIIWYLSELSILICLRTIKTSSCIG